jgi:hypothetical protein
MRFRFLLLRFAASAALAQQPATPPTQPAATGQISSNERFYKNFQITPMGDGDKVLIVLDGGSQKFNAVGAEPVPPKDGGPVTQWTLYNGGFVTLYSKKRIIIPDPNGGEGTPIDGMSVTNLSAPAPGSAPPPALTGHQSSSKFTTPPRKSEAFKMPMRLDRTGFGPGRPRIWIVWDGQHEIEVEPTDTNFRGSLLNLLPLYNLEQWATGNLNHIKFLSNRFTEGSPAPRFFYLKKNKDDSITVYGDDDLAKLKAIDKAK